ncbi:unnamed protein product [Urochloa decumbens]|uniref:Bifunctional inhibitor/plant lipid transfer protein/seed storage helical domain-containing protein n=1 Tax=Urochloa decumbens TaxID=240449 RepID=A0ABC9CC19_9POAL
MANSAASNRKLQLACLLALVVVATATNQQQCTVPPEEVNECVKQIKEASITVPLLSPSCCKELREQIGCGCVLRDAALIAGIDIGAPFCNYGTGCK